MMPAAVPEKPKGERKMKKWLKSAITYLLLVAMLVSLTACGGNGGGDSEINHENGIIGGDDAELSYPLKTDVELDIWTVYSPYHESYTDASQSPWHSTLEEKTGVKVNWKYPVPGADQVQAFNLLMTEEVLPDIIGYKVAPGEASLLIEEGAIIDLTPFLKVYAPDYWAYLNEEGHEDRLRHVSTSDGKVYCIGLFTENEYNSCAYGPIVRKDWLDACGLDIPVTMKDWEEMLEAFRDKYGAKFGSPYMRFHDVGLASGTGAYASLSATYYLDDGEIKFSHTQPEYKEYLTTLNRWVNKGLFDKDTLTMNDEVFRTKMMNNQIGAAYVVNSLFTKTINDAEVVKNGAQWIPVPYPVEKEGDVANRIAFTSNNYPAGCMISTDCAEEEIATALRWLNYGFDKEGLVYFNYGEEGLHHTVDAEGNYAWTPLITNDSEGATMSTQRYTAMGASSVSMPTIQLAQTVRIKNHPVVGEGVNTWLKNQEAEKHLVPTLALTAEERDRHTDLNNAVVTLVNEKAMRIITGEDSIASFDKMVKDAYALGLQEALDIQNAAYQRYLKNTVG